MSSFFYRPSSNFLALRGLAGKHRQLGNTPPAEKPQRVRLRNEIEKIYFATNALLRKSTLAMSRNPDLTQELLQRYPVLIREATQTATAIDIAPTDQAATNAFLIMANRVNLYTAQVAGLIDTVIPPVPPPQVIPQLPPNLVIPPVNIPSTRFNVTAQSQAVSAPNETPVTTTLRQGLEWGVIAIALLGAGYVVHWSLR